jgi:hypothetical protein
VGSKWWSRRAIGLHATLAVVAPGCLAAGWWMFSRATHGDDVAWIYTVEWPFFAGYAVYMWWKLLHDDPEARKAAMNAAPVSEPGGLSPRMGKDGLVPVADGFDPYDESDPELAAYNRYLASLHERDRRHA